MINNRTNEKHHVQDMGFKPKQNRRPDHAKMPEIAGKISCSTTLNTKP